MIIAKKRVESSPLYPSYFQVNRRHQLLSPYLSPLFNSSTPATEQKPKNQIIYICGLGASVGCERVERTFNAPRLKAQIWLMKFTGFVCCLLNELNSKKYCNLFGFHKYILLADSNLVYCQQYLTDH